MVKNSMHAEFCDLIDDLIASCPLDTMAYPQLMMHHVNKHRVASGKSPVSLDLMIRIERTAVGHVDYVSKFARYCLELVEDRSPLQEEKNSG